MARHSTGPALVHRLSGSDEAKRKTKVILSTITGGCTLDDAAEALGMDRSYVFVLRDQILAGAVAAAEPRKPGPKPVEPEESVYSQLLAKLAVAEKQIKDMEVAMELERSRVEIAAVLGPRLKKSAPMIRRPRRQRPANGVANATQNS